MSKKVLILTGSARPNSAGDKLLPYVVEALEAQQVDAVDVAQVEELELPFFNEETPPSAEGREIRNDKAIAWSKRVQSADSVVFLMPEYNRSLSAIQKNAIDWLFSEWQNKPLAMVSYGFYGGVNAVASAKNVMKTMQPDIREVLHVGFMQELEMDGTPKDEAALSAQLDALAKTLIA